MAHASHPEARGRSGMTSDLPKLRLSFDSGTILVEGLPEDDSRGIPGLKRDLRSGSFRAEAIEYRGIIEYLRQQKIDYADDARAYQVANWTIRIDKPAFPHQTEGLAAWDRCGKRGVVVLPTGTGKTHLANLCIQKAGRPRWSSRPPSTCSTSGTTS